MEAAEALATMAETHKVQPDTMRLYIRVAYQLGEEQGIGLLDSVAALIDGRITLHPKEPEPSRLILPA
jgi:hypothetical protein